MTSKKSRKSVQWIKSYALFKMECFTNCLHLTCTNSLSHTFTFLSNQKTLPGLDIFGVFLAPDPIDLIRCRYMRFALGSAAHASPWLDTVYFRRKIRLWENWINDFSKTAVPRHSYLVGLCDSRLRTCTTIEYLFISSKGVTNN